MGTGSYERLCYCKSYTEQGEISSRELINSIHINSNNNSRYINNCQININNNININSRQSNENNNNNNVFHFSIDESDFENNFSNVNGESANDKSIQFNSIKLESIDKLGPEKKNCTICLENFEKNDKVINLDCLHMFHDNCIKTWLKKNNYCPICKNENN